jgi:hypothetical protein
MVHGSALTGVLVLALGVDRRTVPYGQHHEQYGNSGRAGRSVRVSSTVRRTGGTRSRTPHIIRNIRIHGLHDDHVSIILSGPRLLPAAPSRASAGNQGDYGRLNAVLPNGSTSI